MQTTYHIGVYLSSVVLGVLCLSCGGEGNFGWLLIGNRRCLRRFAEDGVFTSGVFVALLINLWYDGNEKQYKTFQNAVDMEGLVNVLRHGFKHRGQEFKVVYFKPETRAYLKT